MSQCQQQEVVRAQAKSGMKIWENVLNHIIVQYYVLQFSF